MGLAVPDWHAIIDPGAAQDLIGETALTARLKDAGLKPVILDERPAAAGIGGSATPKFCALTPVFFGHCKVDRVV